MLAAVQRAHDARQKRDKPPRYQHQQRAVSDYWDFLKSVPKRTEFVAERCRHAVREFIVPLARIERRKSLAAEFGVAECAFAMVFFLIFSTCNTF